MIYHVRTSSIIILGNILPETKLNQIRSMLESLQGRDKTRYTWVQFQKAEDRRKYRSFVKPEGICNKHDEVESSIMPSKASN